MCCALPWLRTVGARPGISPAAGCGESRWVGESTTWASRQEAALVSGRHDGSAGGKALARLAPGSRRESGPSLEDTRRKTSITTGVIVTNRSLSVPSMPLPSTNDAPTIRSNLVRLLQQALRLLSSESAKAPQAPLSHNSIYPIRCPMIGVRLIIQDQPSFVTSRE